MTVLAVSLIVPTACVLLLWGCRHVMIARHRRQSFSLTEEYPSGDAGAGECAQTPEDADPPLISVIVAAKDEQENIESCVRTMLSQDYGDFEMIVANDRSTDRTGEIVERIASEDGRVKLINIEHLPPGWCGKNNAMQTAIAQARGDWLCMIDADCTQSSRRTLSVAMAYARRSGADLLSVLPNLTMHGFWENAIQPVCSGIMMIWFHPDKVNDPKRPHAYANGAFMLMRRSAYERIGTHEAVKDQVNEDMQMAARVKSSGLNLRVVSNRGLYTVRMYTSLREILRGWGRIFFGTFGSFRRIGLSLLALVVMGFLPYAAAAFGFAAVAGGGEPKGLLLAAALVGLAAVAVQIGVIYRFYGLIGAKPRFAWVYPLGCAAGAVALILAMTKLRRGATVTWRDTKYVRGEPEQ